MSGKTKFIICLLVLIGFGCAAGWFDGVWATLQAPMPAWMAVLILLFIVGARSDAAEKIANLEAQNDSLSKSLQGMGWRLAELEEASGESRIVRTARKAFMAK